MLSRYCVFIHLLFSFEYNKSIKIATITLSLHDNYATFAFDCSVLGVPVLQLIAAITFSNISWLYLAPQKSLIMFASCSKSVEANPSGKFIVTFSTMPFCTSTCKVRSIRRHKVSSSALSKTPNLARKSTELLTFVTSNVWLTVNFGVLPKFQSQERNSLVNLSNPVIRIYWDVLESLSANYFTLDNRICLIFCGVFFEWNNYFLLRTSE